MLFKKKDDENSNDDDGCHPGVAIGGAAAEEVHDGENKPDHEYQEPASQWNMLGLRHAEPPGV